MQELLDRVAEWLTSSPVAHATGLSMVLAILRVAYDEQETTWTRISLESAICGLLTLMVGLGVKAFGAPVEWAFIFGGALAFYGVMAFRKLVVETWRAKYNRRGGE